MEVLTVGEAAAKTGWSSRMLRYLERVELVVPSRSSGGYRTYGPRELNQLRALDLLRRRFQLGLDEIAFAMRLRREPDLRGALDAWLAGTDPWTPLPIASPAAWVEMGAGEAPAPPRSLRTPDYTALPRRRERNETSDDGDDEPT